jgi:putative aldouronate transport system substrate-binding protein
MSMSLKQGVSSLIAASLVIVSLTGCGDNGDNGDNKETSGQAKAIEANQPLKLTMLQTAEGEPPQPDNDVEKAIEKYTNTQLDIQWSTAIKDKLPILIASGDLPNVVAVGSSLLKLPYMVNALRSDLFWDLTPYIKDYPNLSKINPQIYENLSFDGKIYGLPQVRPLSRRATSFRQDWLDNLGLKEPKTVDDLYKVLRAFTYDDPDKNGKNDTYGLLEFKDFGILTRVANWLGAPNQWEVKDGKFIAAPTTNEYFAALQFIKRLYDEKIMNQDFAVMEKTAWNAAFQAGKGGMVENITNSAFKQEEELKKVNPNAKLNMFSKLSGPKGDKTPGEGGFNDIIMISKSSVKTEAELKRILSFYEKLGEEPMATLLEWGIEGKHYKLENNKPVYTNVSLYNAEVLPYAQKVNSADRMKNAKPGDYPPLKQLEFKLNNENEKYAVSNPALPFISATYSEKGQELEKIIKDATIKFTMGQLDEAGWKKAVENWRSSGGDKVAEEFAVEYAKINKK